jgi:excinuclease ABC subunit A
MKAADMIIDIGPGSRSFWWRISSSNFDEILKSTSLTAKYLNGELEISIPKKT